MRMDASSSSSITTRIVDTVTTGTLMCVESAAQLSIGQTILRLIDRLLWVVEKSVQWSLPRQEETTEENGQTFGKVELVRPLPWIFFLPTLILLRALRVGINVGALILSYPSLGPCEMVKYLQKSRRRLRAIKINGMKSMRQRNDEKKTKDCEENQSSDAYWRSIRLIRSIQLTLSSLSCLDGSKLSPSPPPTQIKVRMNHESTPTPEESTTESATSPMHVESKRKYSEVSSDETSTSDESDDETIEAKINRLGALEDDVDDDEYIPVLVPNMSDSTSSSSSSFDQSDVSVTEVQDLHNDLNKMLHQACASIAESIREETEPIKRDDSDERTGQKTKFENPKTGYPYENSQENQEFHSPSKLGEEGDSAFYSPISSKSSSPDRTPPALEQGKQIRREESVAHTAENFRNTAIKAKISGAPEKKTNGHADEKRGNAHQTKINKHNHKGRRSSNASRKKK